MELFNFSFFSITGWGIDLDYHDVEWFALETNREIILLFLRLHPGTAFQRRRQWYPTPVLLPGKSHGYPMDGGAWRATVHGVAKSRTRLNDFTFTSHFHALEKEMATHSSVLVWRIPGTGKPGGLPSMGSHRVGNDWSDLAATAFQTLLLTMMVTPFLLYFNVKTEMYKKMEVLWYSFYLGFTSDI